MTDEPKPILVADIENYRNYFLAGFKRVNDGKTVGIEMSSRTPRDADDAKRQRVRGILLQNRIVTFNGSGYDLPLLWYFVCGATNDELKQASDRIINGRVRYWEVEKLLGIEVPRNIDHVDLIEPQPNAFAGLKTLIGRLHGERLQDLPVEPDELLTHAQMDGLTDYCLNSDLPGTHLLLKALREPLEMREAIGADYKMDFRSKSDAQMGEAMIKRRVEQKIGERVTKVPTPAGTEFHFPIPDYIRFEHPQLVEMLERLRTQKFYVQHDGKVELPAWLANTPINIGESSYAMGIGGLHSTESNRTVSSDATRVLIDFDVASYYPAIIINSGLYPKALGRNFLDVFRGIRDERVAAKAAKNSTVEKGLKIALNGCFGKLGSQYSILYAPHLMITTTLTGQLALLMLIDRAESAGIPVVSANTDGVVFHCPRKVAALPIDKTRLTGSGRLREIVEQWERDTGFTLEATEYRSLHNLSVNAYYAVKPDAKVKTKGPIGTPRHEGDLRGQLMKNPQAEIASLAAQAFITNGTPLEETIRASRDVRDFVTVIKVDGGATWRGEYLGKVVRYIWSTDGEEILRKRPHPTTGNHAKVPKTDGCRPLMNLPAEFPEDVDYSRYVAEAEEILMDVGFTTRPVPIKPLRVFKHSAVLWWAVAA